jgi:hypothetical protein
MGEKAAVHPQTLMSSLIEGLQRSVRNQTTKPNRHRTVPPACHARYARRTDTPPNAEVVASGTHALLHK